MDTESSFARVQRMAAIGCWELDLSNLDDIKDEGIGIDPDYHEKIFTPFLRLHTSEKYEGTGIGLAIVKKTVERMGGRVGVEPAPVRGTRFWIELPASART